MHEPRRLGRIELAVAIESPICVGVSGQARRVLVALVRAVFGLWAQHGRVEKTAEGDQCNAEGGPRRGVGGDTCPMPYAPVDALPLPHVRCCAPRRASITIQATLAPVVPALIACRVPQPTSWLTSTCCICGA